MSLILVWFFVGFIVWVITKAPGNETFKQIAVGIALFLLIIYSLVWFGVPMPGFLAHIAAKIKQ